MEANICDVHHLDANVLLPPRKRLLAGFKKQHSDVNDNDYGTSHLPAAVFSSPPSIPPPNEFSNEFSVRLNNLLKSTINNSNLSPEEIAELAESAAIAAVKAAEDARAVAEEKAVIATRAITAAKSALDLVASFDEEAASKERFLKKNKLKKHVPVQLLYKKQQSMECNKTDEEIARRLHRVMNSSPRISKNLTTSDLKGHNHKKSKCLLSSKKFRMSNGGMVLEGNQACTSTGHGVGEVDTENEGTFREVCMAKADERAHKCAKADQLEMVNVEVEASHSKEKALEDTISPGRRRGRQKLKKLPLSICTLKDRVNPKEEMIARTSPLTDKNMGNPPTGGSMPLFSQQPSSDGVIPIEATPTWKCQEFKAPACVKQNKVMQS